MFKIWKTSPQPSNLYWDSPFQTGETSDVTEHHMSTVFMRHFNSQHGTSGINVCSSSWPDADFLTRTQLPANNH